MSQESELKVYTVEEVSEHNTSDDLWVIYNGKVYDVSSYIDEHPGGEEVVIDVSGSDATEAFDDIGHSDDAHEILQGLLIGKVEGGVVKETKQSGSSATSEGGAPLPAVAVLVLLLAFGVYYYIQKN